VLLRGGTRFRVEITVTEADGIRSLGGSLTRPSVHRRNVPAFLGMPHAFLER